MSKLVIICLAAALLACGAHALNTEGLVMNLRGGKAEGVKSMPSVVTWMPAKGGKQGDDVERMRGGGKLRLERTFAIIKPDAVAAGKAQEMKDIITASGFKIVKEKRTRLSEKQAKEFYEEHKERPFYSSLVQFMTGGDCIILVLQKENAIKGWRELMGPTNSLKAKTEAKDSLRAKFGTDGSKNACHGRSAILQAGASS